MGKVGPTQHVGMVDGGGGVIQGALCRAARNDGSAGNGDGRPSPDPPYCTYTVTLHALQLVIRCQPVYQQNVQAFSRSLSDPLLWLGMHSATNLRKIRTLDDGYCKIQ